MAADLGRCVAAIAELTRGLAGTEPGDHTGLGDPADTSDPVRAGGQADADDPAGRRRPAASFRITHVGTGWVMATSDTDAFDRVYEAGHARAVMWRPLPDGSTAYTVGRRSDLVDGFPVGPAEAPGTILGALAAREPGWGGGSSIGGAPRRPDGSRSSLHPDAVFTIVEAAVTAAG
ncbi:hypothetical protein FrCorBMG51_21350 [Protofrankia coriariae]|uniref:Uncharacterized protein n=2 Tax=Protofrankia TaxID=2994361 RepID=A0ABR5EZR1_9ACTN|nr:hypothetical protein FrCorBMG51_21350 [Protofrankia coriariae]